MPRPTDRPLARAQAHLAGGRLAEAIGAFRAVLAIDSWHLEARLGLAMARTQRGERDEAVDELVEAAAACTEAERHVDALSLYGKALSLAPERSEVHLDVAFVESAMGWHDAAVARVEGLADGYMSEGRMEEAAELLRFLASWTADGEESPAPLASTETVVCATVLLRPDGTLMFPDDDGESAPERTLQRAVSAPIVLDEIELDPDPDPDPDMVTHVTHPPPPPRRSREERAEAMAFEARPTIVLTTTPPPRAPARTMEEAPTRVERLPGKLRLERAPRPGARPTTSAPTRPSAPTRRATPPRGPAPSRAPGSSIVVGPGRVIAPGSASSADAPGSANAPSSAHASRTPGSASAPGTPRAPSTSRAPGSASAPNTARPTTTKPRSSDRPNPLADLLRQRAGLGAGGAPRSTKIRATEPIAIRRGWPEVEEEVTQRHRRPELRRPLR